MVKKLKRFISSLENSRVSFGGLLITLLCVILLRNFLETFSDEDNYWTPVSFLANFIHFPMFYISLLLALAFLLRWLTGEKIMSVIKIMLFFFPVILLAPILDLLLSQGQGYNMSYLFGDFSDLIHKFITFSRGFSGRGATPGIRTELAVILLLLAAYLYLKTGKILISMIGIIGSYLIIFLFGSLPSLITELWNLKGADMITGELFAGNVLLHHFYSFNHKMSFVFYPILLIELGICFWMYDRVRFKKVIKNLRVFRVLHYLFMLGFGMFLGYNGMSSISLFNSPFPVLILIASICSVAVAWWFAAGINDLHDVETDKITNPTRPLVSGLITVKAYKSLNLLFIILSLAAAWLIRYPFFVTILLTVALSYIYSAPPFRLKRYAFLSTFILGLSSLLVCLAGFVIFSDDYSFSGFPPKMFLVIPLAFTLAFTAKDIKDMEGDRVNGIKTLPILLGEKKGKKMTGVLTIIAYISIPLILNYYMLIPFALVFGIITYYMINRKKMQEIPVFIMYFIFLGLVLYFFID